MNYNLKLFFITYLQSKLKKNMHRLKIIFIKTTKLNLIFKKGINSCVAQFTICAGTVYQSKTYAS